VGSGAKPQPTNDLVHIGVYGAALVAAVSVDFHSETKTETVPGSNFSQDGALWEAFLVEQSPYGSRRL